MTTREKRLAALCLLSCVLQISSCNESNGPPASGIQNPTQPEAAPSSRVEQIVWPKDWNELALEANFAQTSFDSTGHFATSRNACGFEAYGKVELEFWNQLADALNATVLTAQVAETEEYCVAWPDSPGMDGSVGLKLNATPPVKRPLYYAKGQEICSLFSDHRFSDKLLALLNQLVQIADKKDCPNGWGH